MARKKLLTEGEIRQFMKLANLRPIGRDRLSEYGMPAPGARDEEEADMGAAMEVGDEMEDPDADPMADEMPEEPDMDMAPEGGGDMVSMDDFMDALERAIEEVTGEEADVSEEPGGEEDMEMDMELGGEEPEMAMADEEEEEEPMMEADRGRQGHGGGARSKDPAKNKRGKFGAPDPDDDDSEVLPDDGSDDSVVRRGRESSGNRTDEAIVNEIAKRVAARLQVQNRKEQMVDTLAERIMKRLTK